MIVVNDFNNLTYDDNSKLCKLIVQQSQGQLYAFVQCVDASPDELRAGENRGVKRYWGRFDWANKEACIKDILNQGGKWPILPKIKWPSFSNINQTGNG